MAHVSEGNNCRDINVSGANSMQIGLYCPNHVLLKYKIGLFAGVVLNYFADASWKYDKFLINGDLYVCAEYEFDVLVKNPGLDICKRTFTKVMHTLSEAGVIVKLINKKKLYVHVFPSVIHDLKNAKIILEENTKNEIEQIPLLDHNSEAQKKTSKFQKPTIEEVNKYAIEKGYQIDSELFFHFYESCGWKVGTKPMRSWHSAVVTWSKKQGNFKRNGETEVKKIANGVVVVKTGFTGFVDKCCALVSTLHGKNLDEILVKNLDVFLEQEEIFIEKIGFKKLIQNCQDGDFMDKVELEWEAMS